MFASLSEQTGVRELKMQLKLQTTVADVVAELAQRYPAVAAMGDRLAFAVNLEYVPPTQVLADADELALIPPVSGG